MMNTPMFDPIRYKTEMCKNYQEFGVCKFSDRCLYAHHEWERRPTTYKHKNHKTKLCKAFHSDGYCEFGSRCAFIHSKPDVDTIVQSLDQFVKRIPPSQPSPPQHMYYQSQRTDITRTNGQSTAYSS